MKKVFFCLGLIAVFVLPAFADQAPNTPAPFWDHLRSVVHFPPSHVSIQFTVTTQTAGFYADGTTGDGVHYGWQFSFGYYNPPYFSKDWTFDWTPSDPNVEQAPDAYIYNNELSPLFAFYPDTITVMESPYDVTYNSQGQYEFNVTGGGGPA